MTKRLRALIKTEGFNSKGIKYHPRGKEYGYWEVTRSLKIEEQPADDDDYHDYEEEEVIYVFFTYSGHHTAQAQDEFFDYMIFVPWVYFKTWARNAT